MTTENQTIQSRMERMRRKLEIAEGRDESLAKGRDESQVAFSDDIHYHSIGNSLKQLAVAVMSRGLTEITADLVSEGKATPYLENAIPWADGAKFPQEETSMHQKFKVTAPNGEQVWVTGKSVSDVFNNYASRYSTVEKVNAQASTLTVRQFVEETYQSAFIDGLADTTRENYRLFLELNILPFMGDMKLTDVNVSTIQSFYNWMATASERGRKKNLNEQTIKRVGGLTSRIFSVALDMGYIKETPFKSTLLKIKAEKAGHHKALPVAEIDRVKREISTLADDEERLYMGLLVYTGMRKEEILGLHWDDVMLQEQYCVVEWTVTYPTNSKGCLSHTTKTETSKRTVILPTPLIEIMKPLAKARGLVFGGDEPWCYSKSTRIFARAKKHLNIKEYNNHDFRATYATQLKESGMTSAEVADLLGHADTRMVETTYAPTRHEGVMKKLERVERLNTNYQALD